MKDRWEPRDVGAVTLPRWGAAVLRRATLPPKKRENVPSVPEFPRWSAVSLHASASADAKIGYLMQPAHRKVLTQIQRLERFINDWKMIPATAVRRNRVFLALISKALTVGRAVCVLAKTGFGAEAFGLSRTLVDIYFSVRYMSNKDTEARVDTYADYEARVHKEWVRIYTKYYPAAALKYPPPSQPEIMKLAEKYPSKHQWSGLGAQAKFMALEPDSFETNDLGQPITSEFDYEAQYFWTSHFVHVTVKALEGRHTTGRCLSHSVRRFPR